MPPRRIASTRFRASCTLLHGGALFLLAVVALLAHTVDAQKPHSSVNLTAAWQPLGPSSIVSPTYNNLTGRVAAIAADPNDLTGNTVYLGTTGGGVWKSTNAAGPFSAAIFMPLTDTLPVFSNNAGSSAMPSLTIGALAVQPSVNPVLIAGTGDANNASDSYYGEGLLRSADGGLTWTLVQYSQDGVAVQIVGIGCNGGNAAGEIVVGRGDDRARPQRLPGCGQVGGTVRQRQLLSVEVGCQELSASQQNERTAVKQRAGGAESGARETSRQQAETLTFCCEAPIHIGLIGSNASGDEANGIWAPALAAAVPNRDIPR